MFDSRAVSWKVALLRPLLFLLVVASAAVALNIGLYISATRENFDARVSAAFRDAYDYSYVQTFDSTFKQARDDGFDKGYSKGWEIGLKSAAGVPVSRLVETHNPTYDEMVAFLEEDKTNEKPYIDGEYVCFEFAAELNNNADAKGIQAAYVRLRSDNWGHAVVAFETTDKGLVYIEPQSDSAVDLAVGKPYPWQQVGASSPLNAGDPILDLEMIW